VKPLLFDNYAFSIKRRFKTDRLEQWLCRKRAMLGNPDISG
jgi:hypothetical protein